MSDLCVQRQKRKSDPLELELPIVVSHPAWVTGTELRSNSARLCPLSHLQLLKCDT